MNETSWGLALALLAGLGSAGCVDRGVVGVVRSSEPARDAGASCEGGSCDLCADDDDDCEAPDECDDCAASDSECVELFCRSCESSRDCSLDEPLCVQSRCIDL